MGVAYTGVIYLNIYLELKQINRFPVAAMHGQVVPELPGLKQQKDK